MSAASPLGCTSAKKTADGQFELFSDIESRIKHLTLIINTILFLAVFNLLAGIYNIVLAIAHHNTFNYIGFINIAIAFFIAFGMLRLRKKRDNLKKEGQLFE